MYASDDWPELYRQITAPTLLQWGDGGVVLPPYAAQGSVDALPNAAVTLLRYPESGHMPMLEEPEKTAKDLVAFLNGVYDADARPAGD
jgi:pimeloyl-ACP methyl ester carboxylesterase